MFTNSTSPVLRELFTPFTLTDSLRLTNRIVMAPMTRCFADQQLAPTERTAAYYARRASAGLIVSEATLVTPFAQGYPNTPGIYSPQQVTGWRRVTEAVHQQGGRIICQLWHTGRLAHSHYTGCLPSAPSAVASKGPLPRTTGLFYEAPEAFTPQGIEAVVAAYTHAALNALEAGFDAVELHAANGYLLEQFLRQQTNQRADRYGATVQYRVRLPLEVIDSVINAIGCARTAVRLSPQAYINVEYTPGDEAGYALLLSELNARDLLYVHVAAFDAALPYDYLAGTPLDYVRRHYDGTVIGCGSFTPDTAAQALADWRLDLVAFGRPFIPNPELVQKVQSGRTLEPFNDAMLADYR